MRQWCECRRPLFPIIVILYTTASGSTKAHLGLPAESFDSVILSDEVGYIKRGPFSSGQVPTSVKLECVRSPGKDYSDCRRDIELRNGKFALVVTVTGLPFIFVVYFMLMKYTRRAKFRRQTRFQDFAMFQPTNRKITRSRQPLSDHAEAPCHHKLSLASKNPKAIRTSKVHNDEVRQLRKPMLNDINDGWAHWIYHQEQFADIEANPLQQPVPQVPSSTAQTSAPFLNSGIWAETRLYSLRMRRHNRARLKHRSN